VVRRRHFSPEGIRAVAHTFISIMTYIKNIVKMEKYLRITTHFLGSYIGK